MGRATTVVILSMVLVLFGCTDNTTAIDVTELERGGDIEFICLCERSDGTVEGAPHETCEPLDGDDECQPYALLLQRNRGEVAVVNVASRRLHDSDSRVPFTTFPHVGVFPSDMAVSSDGQTVWVVHLGEPTLAEVETAGLLGPTLPEPILHELPGAASSIVISDDDATAIVTMPELGAIASVDLTTEVPAVTILDLTSEIDPPDPLPEPPEDATEDGDVPEDVDVDGDAPDDVPDDVPADVPFDTPEEADAIPSVGPDFTPVEAIFVPSAGSFFVSGYAPGGGGVIELDLVALQEGTADPLVALHLPEIPISQIAVADVLAIEGDDPPEGLFLYAANRDEALIHVVDLETGEQIDTSGNNPLISGGAIRTDGLVVDLIALEFIIDDDDDGFDDGIDPAFTSEELDPLNWAGVYVFAVTTAGVLHAIDVYDRYCWFAAEGDDAIECTPHVLRNALPLVDSSPYWASVPQVMEADESIHTFDSYCLPGYPCFADYEDIHGTDDTYGVTFYPDLPGDSPSPDIRRPRSEIWTITWEGALRWSSGAGGNVSVDGSTLTDPAMPFCAIGVRGAGDGYEGDTLVIEDGPSPLDDATDCSDWPVDGGMGYRIVTATQTQLEIEPMAQWDLELPDVWLTGENSYPLPTEECFPFATRYHIRTSKQWTVTGSRVGYLHATTTDTEGNCIDAAVECDSWSRYDEIGDCTLRRGRARFDEVFVNPYIRFDLESSWTHPIFDSTTTIEWGQDGSRPSPVMKPGLSFTLLATSGFVPLSEWVSSLPGSMAYLDHYRLMYVSDREYDGMVEFDYSQFRVIYGYD